MPHLLMQHSEIQFHQQLYLLSSASWQDLSEQVLLLLIASLSVDVKVDIKNVSRCTHCSRHRFSVSDQAADCTSVVNMRACSQQVF